MKKIIIICVFVLIFGASLIPATYGFSTVSIMKNELDKDEGFDTLSICSDGDTKYWAVVVGIHVHGRTGTVSEKRLRSLYESLLSKDNWDESNMRCLINEEATRSAILNSLDWLANNVHSNDIVVFSFEGHGSSIDDNNGDESDGKDEGIITWEEDVGNFITDDELDVKFDKISCKGMFLIFHSCLSGGLIDRPLTMSILSSKKYKSFQEEFTTDIEGNNRVIVMSSMDQGLALAFPSLTKKAALGLKGSADKNIDRIITAEEIAVYAKNGVMMSFALFLMIFPPAVISFVLASLIAKIIHDYWLKPFPTIYDGYPGQLPIVEL